MSEKRTTHSVIRSVPLNLKMNRIFPKRFLIKLFQVIIVTGIFYKCVLYVTFQDPETFNWVNKGFVAVSDNLKKTEIDVWMDKMEDKYSKQSKKIDAVCKNIRKERIRVEKYMVDTYFKWGYCATGKAGTSTWAQYFLKLMTAKERPDRFNDTFVKDWRKKQLRPFFKVPDSLVQRDNISETMITKKTFIDFLEENNLFLFTFVRHPFERLVSAYKNKVLDGSYKKMEKVEYRRWLDAHKTFPEFIQLVLNDLKENEHADGHWNQYSKGCLDCDIQYDVIGRMETFEEDVKYIILKNGWEHILPIESITKVHMNKGNTAGIKENEDKKKECLRYFSKLKNSQTQELYEIYKLEFEMLDYDASDYFRIL